MSEGILFGTVLVASIIDSINPCAIGVLVLLVSTLLMLSKDRIKMLKIGTIYISMVYIVYFLAGLGLIVQGLIDLIKQQTFDRKYKIIERKIPK